MLDAEWHRIRDRVIGGPLKGGIQAQGRAETRELDGELREALVAEAVAVIVAAGGVIAVITARCLRLLRMRSGEAIYIQCLGRITCQDEQGDECEEESDHEGGEVGELNVLTGRLSTRIRELAS